MEFRVIEPVVRELETGNGQTLPALRDGVARTQREDVTMTETPACELARTDDSGKLVIGGPEVLDIQVAAPLQEILLRALEEETPVQLDLGCVRRIDTSILQLLTVFLREARAREIEIEWVEPPAGLQESATLLGLSGALGL